MLFHLEVYSMSNRRMLLRKSIKEKMTRRYNEYTEKEDKRKDMEMFEQDGNNGNGIENQNTE